jgi:putative transposase
VTANPDGPWVTQRARNLLFVIAERGQQLRFLISDRDAKFARSFDDVIRSEDTNVLITPVQAPNANAHAERWIRTVRAERLDWLLITGRGHLDQVLRVYVEHYNVHRPHRALRLAPPIPLADPTVIRKMTCVGTPSGSSTDDRAEGLLAELEGGPDEDHRRA